MVIKFLNVRFSRQEVHLFISKRIFVHFKQVITPNCELNEDWLVCNFVFYTTDNRQKQTLTISWVFPLFSLQQIIKCRGRYIRMDNAAGFSSCKKGKSLLLNFRKSLITIKCFLRYDKCLVKQTDTVPLSSPALPGIIHILALAWRHSRNNHLVKNKVGSQSLWFKSYSHSVNLILKC